MKKTVIMMLVALLMLGGCTQIPRSEETGVMPGEYRQNVNVSDVADAKAENEQLRDEIKAKEAEIENIRSDLAKLNEDNKRIMEKLTETEELLKSIDRDAEKFPELSLEQAGREDITKYLSEQGSKLDMKYSSIAMIETSSSLPVIFDTYGYIEGEHQLFGWREGEPEPAIIENASYGKDGSCQWIVEDRYLLVKQGSTNPDEIRIVDVSALAVVNTFESYSDSMLLLPDTSSVLMVRPASEEAESTFIIYDFVLNEETEILPSFKGMALSFVEEEDGNLLFTGVFTDDGMEYRMETHVKPDELTAKYEVGPISEPKADGDSGGDMPEEDGEAERPESGDNPDDSVDSLDADVV